MSCSVHVPTGVPADSCRFARAVVIANITYFIAMFKIFIATRQYLFLLKGGIFCGLSLGVAVALFVLCRCVPAGNF